MVSLARMVKHRNGACDILTFLGRALNDPCKILPYIYTKSELKRILQHPFWNCRRRLRKQLDPLTFRTILLFLYGRGAAP